jgi:diguanylate cyclase (GGDEF)-like protein
MPAEKSAIRYKEGKQSLFESTYTAARFNIVLSTFLGLGLLYNQVPLNIILTWLSAIYALSVVRMLHCSYVLKNEIYDDFHLGLFVILTGLLGFTWSAIYFASIEFVTKGELYLILVVCAGMVSGATATLGVYLPAFMAYALSMFLPVIIYNYSLWDVNGAIFATICLCFILGVTAVAKSHRKLLKNLFFLTEQNKILLEKFELLSITDPLTGLFNRRHFNEVLNTEYSKRKREQDSMALILIDIDNFKLINDNFGHPFGDLFLEYLAKYLRYHAKRNNDLIFRLGGDEFALLLLNTTEKTAKGICNRINGEFLKEPIFEYQPKDELHEKIMKQISLSIGMLYIPADSAITIDEINEKADHLLYQSKNDGKNQFNFSNCIDDENGLPV